MKSRIAARLKTRISSNIDFILISTKLLFDSDKPIRARFQQIGRNIRQFRDPEMDWLSWHLDDSISANRQFPKYMNGGGVSERFSTLLHSCYSIRRSTQLAVLVYISLVIPSMFLGPFYSSGDIKVPIDDLSSRLLTVSEVLGGAAGILFAVIVFGVQFFGEKLDRGSFLVRYLQRREGVLPIAAFTLAVIAANVSVSLISAIWIPYSAVVLAMINVPCVIFILWLALWLIYRMATSVSADPTEVLMPSLIFEYDLALSADIKYANACVVYEKVLQERHLSFASGAEFLVRSKHGSEIIQFGGKGEIVDVNLKYLSYLARVIESRFPDYKAQFSVGPGDKVDNNGSIILKKKKEDKGDVISGALQPLDAVQELKTVLESVFKIQKSHTYDTPFILERFLKMLVESAQFDSAQEFSHWLELLEKLEMRGISRSDSQDIPVSFRRDRVPQLFRGSCIYDIANNVVSSKQDEKINNFLFCLGRLMFAAIEHGQPKSYSAVCRLIEFIYEKSTTHSEVIGTVTSTVDSIMNTSMAYFEYAKLFEQPKDEIIASQQALVAADAMWKVRMQVAAMNAVRAVDARILNDRMFHWDRHSNIRFDFPSNHEVSPERRRACDVIGQANLVLGAWCARAMEASGDSQELARNIFRRCVNDIGSRQNIMRLWELLRSENQHGPIGVIVDDFTRRTIPSPTRPGFPIVSSISDDWVDRGIAMMLLAATDCKRGQTPSALNCVPNVEITTSEGIRGLLGEGQPRSEIVREFLEIDESQMAAALEACSSLIDKRASQFRLARFTSLVEKKLGDAELKSFRTELIERLDSNQGFSGCIKQLGQVRQESKLSVWPRPELTAWLNKSTLLDTSGGMVNYIADKLRKIEFARLIYTAESSVQTHTTVDDTAMLPKVIQQVIDLLKESKNKAVMVFVPGARHILSSINKDVSRRAELEKCDGYQFDFRGVPVFSTPHLEAHSVLILQVESLFGTNTLDLVGRFRLEILDHGRKAHRKLLKKTKKAKLASDIPDENSISVRCQFLLDSDLGFSDLATGLKIELDVTRVGFAFAEQETKFHRANCPCVVGIERSISYSFSKNNGDITRLPCEVCRPDEWGWS